VQIKSWGNGQGIRLSKRILKEAALQVDDYLQVSVRGSEIVLTKAFHHKSLQERAAAFGGELHLSEEVDWGEPQGNEVL